MGTATVFINVIDNTAPVAHTKFFNINVNIGDSATIDTGVTDADGDTLTFAIGYKAPAYGTVTFDGRVGQPQVDGFPPAPYPQVHNEEGDFFVVVQVEPKPPALKSVTVDVYWNVDKKVTLQSYFGS